MNEAAYWAAIGAFITALLTAIGVLVTKVLPEVTKALTERSKRRKEEREHRERLNRASFQPMMDILNGHIANQESRIAAMQVRLSEQEKVIASITALHQEYREKTHAERDEWNARLQKLVVTNMECEQRVAVLTARIENLEQTQQRQGRHRSGPTK
jgi:uncharacterized small protein (DUF1192 family)